MYHVSSLRDTAETSLRGEFISLSARVRKEESLGDLSCYLKNLEEGEQSKTRASEEKAVTRTEINEIEKSKGNQ